MSYSNTAFEFDLACEGNEMIFNLLNNCRQRFQEQTILGPQTSCVA